MSKKLYSTAVFVAIGFSLSFAAPVNAAPMVDQSQIISSTAGFTVSRCEDMGFVVNWGAGSTFTAGVSGLLTSIDVPMAGTTTPSGVTMNVWNADGVSGLPTGVPIASQGVSVETLNSVSGGGNLSVVFATPATVVEANKYAFTLDFRPDCVGQTYQLSMVLGDAPSGKRAMMNMSGNFQLHPEMGIGFTTFVDSPQTPSPATGLSDTGFDGNTVGLLAGGAALVVVLAAGVVFTTHRRTAL